MTGSGVNASKLLAFIFGQENKSRSEHVRLDHLNHNEIQDMEYPWLYQTNPSLEGLRELLFSLSNLEEDVDQVHPRGQHNVKVVQLRLALRPDAQEVQGVEDAGVEVEGGVPDL